MFGRIVFLGTSSAVPQAGKRNVSSLALQLTSGRAVLMDCGEATQHQIQQCSGLTAQDIDVILLTHLHGDHSFGIFGLLCSIGMFNREHELTVVGPAGINEYVVDTLTKQGGLPHYPLKFIELTEETELKLCDLRITAIPIPHSERVKTFGYVVVEPDRPGKLDGERAKQLGVSGPELGRLKKGQDVALADGRLVKSSDVVSPDVAGRTVALVQDTFDGSSMLKACHRADIVIHEATFDNSMRERAVQKGHSTAEMAAQFAAAAKATLLVLTHFSARYCDDASPLEHEAKAVHENTIAAEDFMELKWVKSALNVSHAKRLDAQ